MIQLIADDDYIQQLYSELTWFDMLSLFLPIIDELSDNKIEEILVKYIEIQQKDSFPYTRMYRVLNIFFSNTEHDRTNRLLNLTVNKVERWDLVND